MGAQVAPRPRKVTQRPREEIFVDDHLQMEQLLHDITVTLDAVGVAAQNRGQKYGELQVLEGQIEELKRDIVLTARTEIALKEADTGGWSVAAQERYVENKLTESQELFDLEQRRREARTALEEAGVAETVADKAFRAASMKLEGARAILDFYRAARDARSMFESTTSY